MTRVLERDIEKACVHYATCRGIKSRKLRPPPAGWPDRVFLLPGGTVWWVEFKRPGGRLSPIQKAILEGLAQSRHAWTIIDNVQAFQDELNTRIDKLRYTRIRQVINTNPRKARDEMEAPPVPTGSRQARARKPRLCPVP